MGITPGPDTLKQLPKINLSGHGLDLFPGTPTWDRVGSDVLRALVEFGCFEAVHETLIPGELHGSLLKKDGLIEELFGLPMEVKRRFVDSKMPLLNGYQGGDPKLEPLVDGVDRRTQRERVVMNGVLDSPVIRDMTHLLWPHHGNSNLSESLVNYAKKVSTLDQLVKRMVFEQLGVEKYFDSHVESSFYTMRINKYAPPDTEEEQLQTRPHLDKSFLTILQQNQVNGLMMQTKEGEWFNVSFSSPSSFIVLVGESFVAWSNGRFHCPRHNVVMRGGETRLSIGMFSSVKGTVKCPEELIDEDHPLLFKPFEEIDLFRFVLTEEGRKPESTIKAYFGV